MDQASAIQLNGLSKSFGRGQTRIDAVKNVNLNIAPGQVYGFLGPNGAGKTTTIRMITGLIHPTAGDVHIFGQDVRAHQEALRRIGAVVEGAAFYPFLSGRRNLEVLARTSGSYGKALKTRIADLLAQVGLHERADQRVRGYSLGMRQRLGVAAALLSNPDILIFDEPTNGLDPEGMTEIRRFIRAQAVEHGKTIFLSSHLLHEVENLCDRVAIIHRGVIVREGSVSELLDASTRLRIEVSPRDIAIEALRGRWTASPVTDVENALLVDAPRAAIPELVRALVAQNVDVYQVVSERQNLEAFFLTVIQQQNGEAASHAATLSG